MIYTQSVSTSRIHIQHKLVQMGVCFIFRLQGNEQSCILFIFNNILRRKIRNGNDQFIQLTNVSMCLVAATAGMLTGWPGVASNRNQIITSNEHFIVMVIFKDSWKFLILYLAI